MSTYYINAYNKKRKIAIPIEEKWMCCNFEFDEDLGSKVCVSDYDLLETDGDGVQRHESVFNSHCLIPYTSQFLIDSSKVAVIDYWNAIKLINKNYPSDHDYDEYQAPSALLKPTIGNTVHNRIGDKINVKNITYGLLFTLRNSDYAALQWSNELKGQNALLQKIQTAASSIPDYLANNGQNVYTLYASAQSQSKDLFNFVYDSTTSQTIASAGGVNQRINPNMKLNFRLFVVEFAEKWDISSMTPGEVNDLIVNWYKKVYKHNSYFPNHNTQSNKINIKEESNYYAGEFKIKLDKSFKLTSSKPYKYLDLSFAVNQNCELRKTTSTYMTETYKADKDDVMYINAWANTLMFVISPCYYTTDIDPSTYKLMIDTNLSPVVNISGNAKMIFYDV